MSQFKTKTQTLTCQLNCVKSKHCLVSYLLFIHITMISFDNFIWKKITRGQNRRHRIHFQKLLSAEPLLLLLLIIIITVIRKAKLLQLSPPLLGALLGKGKRHLREFEQPVCRRVGGAGKGGTWRTHFGRQGIGMGYIKTCIRRSGGNREGWRHQL